MVPCCWIYNLVSTEKYIYTISGFRKYICGKGGLGAKPPSLPPPPPPPHKSIWKYQIKWNHFHHMGPEYLFFTIFEAILFLVPLLHIKNQNIFSDKNPAPPPRPISKWSVPYAICEQQRRRSGAVSAQSGQHLCCSLPRQYDISSIYIGNFMTLANFFSWADRFESYLVENPEDRFSRGEAHMGTILFFNLPSKNLKSGGLHSSKKKKKKKMDSRFSRNNGFIMCRWPVVLVFIFSLVCSRQDGVETRAVL